MPKVRTREVLKMVLLETLAVAQEGLTIDKAYEEVDGQYTFPDHWYREMPLSTGYEELKRQGIDWHELSQEQLIELVKTEPQWQNEMRWARQELRQAGLLDGTAPRGVWRLTPKGREAANRGVVALSAEEKSLATPKAKPSALPAKPNRGTESFRPSHRESLQQKLAVLTSSMSLADLQLLVDIARSIRLRTVEG